MCNLFARILSEFGENGVISWNPKKQRGIIRVNNKWVHALKSCFLFINNIDGKNAIIKSIGLSGIIKKAKSKYIAM